MSHERGRWYGRAARLLALMVVVSGSLIPVLGSAEEHGNAYFEEVWARTDKPVADLAVQRTWMWGVEAYTELLTEPYDNSPGGTRLVQYYDKSRMEINNPNSDRNSEWFVTNGLLAQELITGQMKFGDTSIVQYEPANVNVAGDLDDPSGPTYASFNGLMGYAPIPSGWLITQTVDRQGNVVDGGALGQLLAEYGVTAQDVGAPTGHNVASVFWQFMNSGGLVYENGQYVNAPLSENAFYITGYPLTEAYWTIVRVAGESKRVLVQVFERRVMTYTPDNPDGWKVEAGNVGLHYFNWRYDDLGQEVSWPVPSLTGQVNITYVQSATVDNQDHLYEYVRMFNVDVGPINMGGWTLEDLDGNVYMFPTLYVLPGESVAVWVCTSGDGAADYNLHWGLCQEVWDNVGDVAYLYNSYDQLVDTLSVP